jgi:hypothetical protein
MGSNIEIFEVRVLGENLYLHQRFTVFKVEHCLYINQKLRFSPKTLASNISMLEPIQDNDNYKPHAKKIIQIYTCLLKLSRKQESVTDGRPKNGEIWKRKLKKIS